MREESTRGAFDDAARQADAVTPGLQAPVPRQLVGYAACRHTFAYPRITWLRRAGRGRGSGMSMVGAATA
ncbi:hypothetical protein PSP6_270201 [Paraburkholderia tropica]|nr:hypothetical protein PSP6_270201 [Paraburkholderia tropica]